MQEMYDANNVKNTSDFIILIDRIIYSFIYLFFTTIAFR